MKCDGKRSLMVGANGLPIERSRFTKTDEENKTVTNSKSVRDEKANCIREEALEQATLEVWNSLIPQLERELKRL